MSETPFTSRNYGGVPIGKPSPHANLASVQLIHPHANVPVKSYDEGISYDVDVVERCDGRTEDMVNDVTVFDTGIAVKPPQGFYMELVAHPMLYKEGYLLVNGLSVLDPDDQGRILVGLYKFKDGDDLKLPHRAIQIIPRKAEYVYMGESTVPLIQEEPQQQHRQNNVTFSNQPSFESGSREKGKEKIRPQPVHYSSQPSRGRNGSRVNSMFG